MPALIDITLPDAQEGTESVVERWLRQPGDRVRAHEPLLEINTDKAVVEVAAPAEGILREILKQPNESVGPGEVVGRIEAVDAGSERAGPGPAAQPALEANAGADAAKARADLSPAVRQLVKQHGIDVSRLTGTGRGGRITHEDVQNYLKQRAAGAAPAPAAPAAGRRVPHSPLRRRIAQHMVESMLKTAPHVTAVFEADLSAALAHRHKHRDEFQKQGVRLTLTAYLVAATVKALQAVPEVNSRWHDDALEIMGDCNIGIATAVEGGLLVPVIHQAQTLDLLATARRLQELTEKARAGKLEPAELRGGTFTITNHGVSGSLIATPIINQPQSAILGVGKVEKRLVVAEENGQDVMRIRPLAYVTLTIDHRALDGFQANSFLSAFVDALGPGKGDGTFL